MIKAALILFTTPRKRVAAVCCLIIGLKDASFSVPRGKYIYIVLSNQSIESEYE